jgi:REP element-mobilizing transposase RayT
VKTYRKPPRLATLFQEYVPPLYFITFCTMHRRPLLANEEVHDRFRRYGDAGISRGVGVGRYVIMPDHVHLFVRLSGPITVGIWVRGLKRAMLHGARECRSDARLWQPGFFDHVMRHDESYSQKWEYVRENPVRKGLVSRAEDWPYGGEIVVIRWVR